MGDFARAKPEIVRQVAAAGHVLGNHTMSHPRLSTEPAARVRQELAECNAALEEITGAAVKFFRPPFGARRPYVLRAARELGLTPVMWNVTGYDWNPIGIDGILANLDEGIARNRGGAWVEPAAARWRTLRDGRGADGHGEGGGPVANFEAGCVGEWRGDAVRDGGCVGGACGLGVMCRRLIFLLILEL